MTQSSSAKVKTYKEVDMKTQDSTRMVVTLYEGAIRFIGNALADIDKRDRAAKGNDINKAIAIIDALQSNLDFKKGKTIARQLDRLYSYFIRRLTEANINMTKEPLIEVGGHLKSLKESWEGALIKIRAQPPLQKERATSTSLSV